MVCQAWMKDGSGHRTSSTTPNLKTGCWLTGRDMGENRMIAAKECLYAGGRAVCTECIRYIQFYERADKLEQAGISFGDAVKLVRKREEEGEER